jgi:hypothetical protein
MFKKIRTWFRNESNNTWRYERASQAGRFQVLIETAIRDMSEAMAALESPNGLNEARNLLEDSRDYLSERYKDILGIDDDIPDAHPDADAASYENTTDD